MFRKRAARRQAQTLHCGRHCLTMLRVTTTTLGRVLPEDEGVAAEVRSVEATAAEEAAAAEAQAAAPAILAPATLAWPAILLLVAEAAPPLAVAEAEDVGVAPC